MNVSAGKGHATIALQNVPKEAAQPANSPRVSTARPSRRVRWAMAACAEEFELHATSSIVDPIPGIDGISQSKIESTVGRHVQWPRAGRRDPCSPGQGPECVADAATGNHGARGGMR